MKDSLVFLYYIPILLIWFLGLALFYYVIKTAIRNGVKQANVGLVESVREIEKSVIEIKMGITKKEST